ncbi:hypothetical protein EKO04_011037 [Ascochyta lentis]|uniref:DNA recombination and repair protein Rad51-like C-terminal domain-containing protein n=1 Tax=Ascochyta lentis TaxID=205686 RepID=A0A8H7IU40_9PLEO|nr:hypothetical protein EKO04_011037 [Ascochyta lentis]
MNVILTVGCENTEAESSRSIFGIPELDALITSPSPSVLELVSPPPTHHPSGAGKTSLLYLIIAHAILPATFDTIPDLNGHNAAIILFDPLHHFSVPRLASTMLHLLTSKLQTPAATLDESTKTSLINLTALSLDHVHIFHPQSWASLQTTLATLPEYLFNTTRHKSTNRRIHTLILEDTDAFTWPLRAMHSSSTTNPHPPPSQTLTTQLLHLSTLLSCNILTTSPSLVPTAFRPALPSSWPSGVQLTRLAVRRIEVVKFAPEMSIEQAEAEKGARWDVVRRGRFECWRVGGAGLGPRRHGNAGEEQGFVFCVGREGVSVEREERG